MSRAVSAFDSQEYDAAHNQAAAIMNKSTGVQREEAAYIAGLSSYQMGNHSAADSELSVAAVSSDPQTAGSAKAMLGQLRLDQRRPREAATCFADASRLLEGEDARQAAWHAGVAFRQAGDEASAKRWLDNASSAQYDQQGVATGFVASASSDPAGSSPMKVVAAQRAENTLGATTARESASAPPAQPASVGFTLQVGAFNDRARAKKAAQDADALSKKEGLGRVRVLPRRDAHGQPMYLVQVGWWVTRSEAAEARARVGRLEYIVAPAAPLT
jgi:cell division septation protein DedD